MLTVCPVDVFVAGIVPSSTVSVPSVQRMCPRSVAYGLTGRETATGAWRFGAGGRGGPCGAGGGGHGGR